MITHRTHHGARRAATLAGLTLGASLGLADAAQARDRWIPSQGDTWWWQLENAGEVDVSIDADVFDIDLFEGVETGKIAELKAAGKRVVCYFSAGTYEPWRPDADRFTAESLIDGAALPQFDEETWLDIADPEALADVIRPIMRARFGLARRAGCDAVETDNMDGFTNDETAGAISALDQLRYNRWLAGVAHRRGMSIALKNDLEQVGALEPYFDFAISEQCFGYAECSAYDTTFLANGKAVFNQEYGGGGDEGDVSLSDYANLACPEFRAQGVSSLWKETLSLDGRGVVVCAPD